MLTMKWKSFWAHNYLIEFSSFSSLQASRQPLNLISRRALVIFKHFSIWVSNSFGLFCFINKHKLKSHLTEIYSSVWMISFYELLRNLVVELVNEALKWRSVRVWISFQYVAGKNGNRWKTRIIKMEIKVGWPHSSALSYRTKVFHWMASIN